MKIKDLKPLLLPTKIKKVDSKLYSGSAVFFPVKALRLKRKGITQVIDLRHEDSMVVRCLKKLEKCYCNLMNIDYVNKSFYKNNVEQLPNEDFFVDLIKQIDKGQKTYIHCHYGKHRTGFSVAMYQREKGVPKNTIIYDLLDNGWSTKKQKNILKTFYEKFLK